MNVDQNMTVIGPKSQCKFELFTNRHVRRCPAGLIIVHRSVGRLVKWEPI